MSAQPRIKYLAWNIHERRMAPVAVLNLANEYAIVDVADGQECWYFWMIELLEWTGIGEGENEVYEGEVWEREWDENGPVSGVVTKAAGAWMLEDGPFLYPICNGMVYLGNKYEQPELVTN